MLRQTGARSVTKGLVMDSMRGFADEPGPLGLFAGSDPDDDLLDGDLVDQPLPPLMGADERRMQVRAYNFWAGMLGDSRLPLVGPLLTGQWPDFADHAVLLQFDAGLDDPAIAYVGDALLADCAGEGPLARLSQVPGRSILSRITDHYMQIVANEAPIGFEAEFANQRGRTILYRGILLPFSSSGDTLDYIFGVINWKELADQATTNGRDRTTGFNECMKAKYPGVTIIEQPTYWKTDKATSAAQTVVTTTPDLTAIYMQSDSVMLAGVLNVLKSAGKLTKVGEPNHIFLATVDGTPFALEKIREDLVDVTVAQPLDLYAKYGAFYAKAAAEGKTFSAGPTDHGSEIVPVGDNLMDYLPATVVTKANASDPSLWGNQSAK